MTLGKGEYPLLLTLGESGEKASSCRCFGQQHILLIFCSISKLIFNYNSVLSVWGCLICVLRRHLAPEVWHA